MGAYAGPDAHDFDQTPPLETHRDPVVRRIARGQDAAGHEPAKRGSPLRFTVIVGTEAARQHAQGSVQGLQLGPKRVRYAGLEPAYASGTGSAKDDAAAPRLAENSVNPVAPPD